MAAFTAKRFSGPLSLTTSEVTQFTIASGRSAVVKQFVFTNHTANAATVTVNLVPSGGSASSSNRIIGGLSIGPNSTIIVAIDLPMAAADFIVATCSAAASVNLTVSGVEII